ncbi:MAG: serine protease [Chloroflexota bacterium]|nr:serine protease [Chloroflexota bacterium]
MICGVPTTLPDTAAGAGLTGLAFMAVGLVVAVAVLRRRRPAWWPAVVLPGLALLALMSLPAAAVECDDTPAPAPVGTAGDRAVVVAVIDNGNSPYHYDFLASRMPQAGTADALPLDQPPDTYLAGFPAPSTFADYGPLNLTLPGDDPDQAQQDLFDADAAQWDTMQQSNSGTVHYRWVPGTKLIGILGFGGASPQVYSAGAHGMGTSSVSTGNIHGTCPECLLVFIQYTNSNTAEDALTWAMSQPWIDVITNSYGFSSSIELRDRIYNGTDVATEKAASDRGQVVFFSAGNGLENAFTIPNSTLLSSQEGPDWVVTVGATSPADNDFTGTGKPAKVAGIGYGYPSAYGSSTVSDGDDFSGTSNATPEVAGIYAHALYRARQDLGGPSRVQEGGVVATGPPQACGAAIADCAMGDGQLTALELRYALYHGATPTKGYFEDGVTGIISVPVAIADSRFATEGHGTYRGLLDGPDLFQATFEQRLYGVLFGRQPPPDRPVGEVDWMRVDSWCRQHIWGEWGGGYYTDATNTPLPSSDPVGWPIRSTLQAACPSLQPPPKT